MRCSDADLVAAQPCRGSAGGHVGGPVHWQLHSIPLHTHKTCFSGLHTYMGVAACRQTQEVHQTRLQHDAESICRRHNSMKFVFARSNDRIAAQDSHVFGQLHDACNAKSEKGDCTRGHLISAEALGDGVKGGVLQGMLPFKQLAGQPPAGAPSSTPRACEASVHHWGPRVHRGGSCLHVAGLRCYTACDQIHTVSADNVPQSLLVL